ncbi:MAG: tRNA (adenosine(37)-N6)-threonylcarbamoyltransferase complex ATPase subunit type 1 TsaE [Candidatus Eisenbacteria bacterium]|nr:tRNA (adenosine(37)-N6)-threonylcarbamoyltransferase complex ATPase subunit type 1 TsaE [Candidatus Eisenbacteria bacterium]
MSRAELTIVTRAEEETLHLAARFAEALRAGDIVALCGELGTGKTRFVAGAARALGYRGRVRSPSFTLLNIYRGRLPLYHFDLYRWDPESGAGEREEWLELMEDEGISFIEWAQRWGADLPPRHWRIELRHAGAQEREIRIRQTGMRLGPLHAAWRDERRR